LEEKGKAANLHNELQYNKMQLAKHAEELKDARVKLVAAKKTEELL